MSVNNGFAWDHGYYAPEIDNTWLGSSAPGVAHKGVDGRRRTRVRTRTGRTNSEPQLVTSTTAPAPGPDHTDTRPTLIALIGLKDDYIGDGRVLVRGPDRHTGPDRRQEVRGSGVCYKQLNSSVGQFGTDVLVADTAALKTGSSSDDSAYKGFAADINSLGAKRDKLATTIKEDLYNAAFNNTPIPSGNSDSAHCKNLIKAADKLVK